MTERFRILIADKLGTAGLEILAGASDVVVDNRAGIDASSLRDIIGDYHALIVRSATRVSADVLAEGKRLQVVGRAGIGVDNIDVKAATARGVVVTNTPEANALATAEYAFGLLLAAARHIPASHQSLARGAWARASFVGRQLSGKSLGIVGLGQIGRLVARRAAAFDMDVLACDPFVSEDVAQTCGVELLDLEDLLARADFVTLHASLSAATENLVDAKAIAAMKPGVVLVNAARGKLVDEQALAAALDDGRVAAAAIDVYSHEPPDATNPLLGRANVVHTPHLAASTEEAQRDVAVQIAHQVLDALRGVDYRNSINLPFVAGPEFATTVPYLTLAEKMGVLHFHMAPERIERVEIAVQSDGPDVVRSVAAAFLKGLLQSARQDSVNYVNAPLLAAEQGISVAQITAVGHRDYTNTVMCRVFWNGGSRDIVGALFGGTHPRIVQVSRYHIDVDPSGIVLMMLNRDVPGVVGDVGSVLGRHGVNIGEWRLGREEIGGDALSFVNLDDHPPAAAIEELESLPAVVKVRVLEL